jgi:hypothetical protein
MRLSGGATRTESSVVDGDRGDALDVISVAVIATVLQASAAKLAT